MFIQGEHPELEVLVAEVLVATTREEPHLVERLTQAAVVVGQTIVRVQAWVDLV